jgi:hypothetical protein
MIKLYSDEDGFKNTSKELADGSTGQSSIFKLFPTID